MSELIRTDIVANLAILLVFHFIARSFLVSELSEPHIKQWRNALLLVTNMAFLIPNVWFFYAFAAVQMISLKNREPVLAARYALLLPAVPDIDINIAGIGPINRFTEISYPRLLSLFMLIPARQRRTSAASLSTPSVTDRLFIMFVGLLFILNFRDTTLTDGLRMNLNALLDLFFPYWVLSKTLHTFDQMRKALLAIMITSTVLAVIGGVEYAKHWMIYTPMVKAWGGDTDIAGGYLMRGDSLRAATTLTSPIIMGFLMVVALAAWQFLSSTQASGARKNRLIPIVLSIGLFVPVSRGPWVGMAVFLIGSYILRPNGFKQLLRLGLMGAFSLMLVSMAPGGEKIINVLPIIGHTEEETVTYRQTLFNNSWVVIQRNFWLGSLDYLATPEMQALKQGQGIVDIVNTYVGIALQYGMLATSLFILTLLSAMRELLRIAHLCAYDPAYQAMRYMLFGLLAAIMFMISGVSPISIAYQLLLFVLAISTAFVRMVQKQAIHLPKP